MRLVSLCFVVAKLVMSHSQSVRETSLMGDDGDAVFVGVEQDSSKNGADALGSKKNPFDGVSPSIVHHAISVDEPRSKKSSFDSVRSDTPSTGHPAGKETSWIDRPASKLLGARRNNNLNEDVDSGLKNRDPNLKGGKPTENAGKEKDNSESVRKQDLRTRFKVDTNKAESKEFDFESQGHGYNDYHKTHLKDESSESVSHPSLFVQKGENYELFIYRPSE